MKTYDPACTSVTSGHDPAMSVSAGSACTDDFRRQAGGTQRGDVPAQHRQRLARQPLALFPVRYQHGMALVAHHAAVTYGPRRILRTSPTVSSAAVVPHRCIPVSTSIRTLAPRPARAAPSSNSRDVEFAFDRDDHLATRAASRTAGQSSAALRSGWQAGPGRLARARTSASPSLETVIALRRPEAVGARFPAFSGL